MRKMRKIGFLSGYLAEWLFDGHGMALGLSFGEILTIGGAGLAFIGLIRVLGELL